MTDRSRLRLVVLGVLVISLVVTLLGRLWYLQVLAAPQFRAEAQSSQTRTIVTQAPRGEIVDDEGRPLVTNKTALVVSVNRSALDLQPNDGEAVLNRLAKVLNVSYGSLKKKTTPCVYVKVGKTVTDKVYPCYNGYPQVPIPVGQLKPTIAATKQALQIESMQEKFPGITVAPMAVRSYPEPLGALAAPILGYISPISAPELSKLSPAQQDIQRGTDVGTTGLEYSYNTYLRGKPGLKQLTVDHLGAVTGTVKTTAPTAGDDVVTNIDAKAQATLETTLQNAITSARNQGKTADYAAGVVMNVRTGGIVAMASNPSYNPRKPPPAYTSQARYNHFAHSEGHPFVDKAFGSMNPPGSTFKPISSTGMISDGELSTGGAYDCPTNFQHRHNFDSGNGAGFISLHEALVISCDTFFFRLGFGDWVRDNNLVNAGHQPREGVQKLARAYGYGEDPKIDLPGAVDGHIADRKNTKSEWIANRHYSCERVAQGTESALDLALDRDYCKNGYIFRSGDQENEDVGQGTVLASPLQVAVAYSALANGGKVFEPRVAKAILSPSGKLIKRIKAPVRDHLPISQANLDYIRNALYGVTSESSGTAAGAFAGFPMGQVQVGGKTGTAELSGTNQNGAWFASFGGPAGQTPQYVTVIEVDKSDQGATSAAPFVKSMWESLYGLNGKSAIFAGGVPPTKLPKVGIAALKVNHGGTASTTGGKNSNSTSTPSGTSPSSPPSSPTSKAAGLPPGLAVGVRGWRPA